MGFTVDDFPMCTCGHRGYVHANNHPNGCLEPECKCPTFHTDFSVAYGGFPAQDRHNWVPIEGTDYFCCERNMCTATTRVPFVGNCPLKFELPPSPQAREANALERIAAALERFEVPVAKPVAPDEPGRLCLCGHPISEHRTAQDGFRDCVCGCSLAPAKRRERPDG